MKIKIFFNQSGNSFIKLILLFAGLTAVIFLIFFAIRFINDKKAPASPPEKNTSLPAVSTSSAASEGLFVLPASDETGESASGTAGQATETAEKYFPGDFYKAPAAPVDFTVIYSLPINSKTDIANYYDFSRKINLDKVLDKLNSSGFAIIDNPFLEAKNFYEAYAALDSRQIPPLITADFLTYYYQNITKLAYKKIESAVFYDALWQTNKKLYEIAKERYEKKYSSGLLINDISLEGARRELAFLAVSLALLQPEENQIGADSGLGSDGKFSTAEAEEFSFYLPEYLKNDVASEISLIRAASSPAKSPVLLYGRDYLDFSVPEEYRASARLNNFYLSSLWLSSVWPLYPKDVDCPDCFLDKEDWRVSLYAALLLADDLSSSQDLKNQWAQIYKIKSFFTGLRADLNYLHYREALDKVFGADKKAAESLIGENVNSNLIALAEEIAKFDFPAIEGGRDKKSSTAKPYIGLKMLAEAYQPAEYIFANLTATSAGAYLGTAKEAAAVATACVDKRSGLIQRCLPSALDAINLVADKASSESYFSANANYEFYAEKIGALKKELSLFTDHSWHNNNFWLSLDIIKKDLAAPPAIKPIFARGEDYRQRDVSRALASWVNFQLPPDKLALNSGNSSRLGGEERENDLILYAYIEPNQALVAELPANAKMMIDFLTALKIGDRAGAALYDLRNLEKNLAAAGTIIAKEASGGVLTEEDYKFIANFYREFSVSKAGGKILSLNSFSGEQKMQEKLEGIKFLLAVYQRGAEKIIVTGPIFDYKEERSGK